eukprot:gene26114-biopygen14131
MKVTGVRKILGGEFCLLLRLLPPQPTPWTLQITLSHLLITPMPRVPVCNHNIHGTVQSDIGDCPAKMELVSFRSYTTRTWCFPAGDRTPFGVLSPTVKHQDVFGGVRRN